jgi:hypothetical protein
LRKENPKINKTACKRYTRTRGKFLDNKEGKTPITVEGNKDNPAFAIA